MEYEIALMKSLSPFRAIYISSKRWTQTHKYGSNARARIHTMKGILECKWWSIHRLMYENETTTTTKNTIKLVSILIKFCWKQKPISTWIVRPIFIEFFISQTNLTWKRILKCEMWNTVAYAWCVKSTHYHQKWVKKKYSFTQTHIGAATEWNVCVQ